MTVLGICLGMNTAAIRFAPSVYKIGAVRKHASVIAKAKQAGKQAVEGNP